MGIKSGKEKESVCQSQENESEFKSRGKERECKIMKENWKEKKKNQE